MYKGLYYIYISNNTKTLTNMDLLIIALGTILIFGLSTVYTLTIEKN